MVKSTSLRLQEIHDQVNRMDYSIDNVLEIISLFKEALKITRKTNPHISRNRCLAALKHTKDSEYSILISQELEDDSERVRAFKEFKFVFLRDLEVDCC
ncbi:MAG: hypothetical protein Q7J06_10870 [Bacteroidales bacterium]|nr:hypothetical protein [Bacteroidales bacterium]